MCGIRLDAWKDKVACNMDEISNTTEIGGDVRPFCMIFDCTTFYLISESFMHMLNSVARSFGRLWNLRP